MTTGTIGGRNLSELTMTLDFPTSFARWPATFAACVLLMFPGTLADCYCSARAGWPSTAATSSSLGEQMS